MHKIQKKDSQLILELLKENKSSYDNLDINETINFFIKRYINSLNKIIDISNATAIDCGCGYGWFGFAYILSGGKHITLVEPDSKRLLVVRNIANILHIPENRIDFINNSFENLDYKENEFDIFVSIETLEHIGKRNIARSLNIMKKLSSKVLLLTTPNKYFPLIAHDTRLPFIHWFPIRYRQVITKFIKKGSEHNDFVSPLDLAIFNKKFKRISKCLSFQSYQEYINHYPIYLPYGSDNKVRYQYQPSIFKKVYYFIISTLLATKSYYFMPSLSSIYKVRDGK